MKTAILCLSILGFSVSAVAAEYGTPDQDPIVKDLRERFSNGKRPTADQLLGKRFNCKEMLAERGDFDKHDYTLGVGFSSFDGYLKVSAPETLMDGQFLVANGAEYIAGFQIDTGVGTIAYRIDSKGYLVGEWSVNATDLTLAAELDPIASAAPDSRVVSYTLCVPKP